MHRHTVPLATTLAFALASTTAGIAQDRPFEGITLGVSLVANELVDDVILPNLAEFEERTGITVNLDPLAYANLYEKQVIEMAGNSGVYDVMLINDVWVSEYADAGFLLPLEEVMEPGYTDGFYTDVLAVGAVDGVQYAIPQRINSYGLVYWRTALEEAGLDVPETWEELLAAAEALTDGGRFGAAIAARRGPAAVNTWEALVLSAGGSVFDEEWRPQFNSPEGVAALELLTELVELSPVGATAWHWPEARAALSEGLAAMHLGGVAVISSMDDPEVTRYPGEYDIAPMPVPAERLGEESRTLITVYNWSIASNTPNPEAAWEFIRWITSEEMERAHAEAAPRVPIESARIAYYEDPEVLAARPIAATLQQMAADSSPSPLIPEWPEIQSELALRLSEAFLGEKSAEQALGEAQDLAEQLMRRAGYFE